MLLYGFSRHRIWHENFSYESVHPYVFINNLRVYICGTANVLHEITNPEANTSTDCSKRIEVCFHVYGSNILIDYIHW